jgi:glucose-6-phosphate isomerase
MSITAGQLSGTSLRLDWSHLNGKTNFENPSDLKSVETAWNTLRHRFQSGEVGFYDSPVKEELSQLEKTLKLAKEFLANRNLQDCLFLGIGGSALGPKMVLNALNFKSTGLQFHFLENPDPLQWNHTLKKLSPEKTLICVVTKSGGTFETVAQFLTALEWLGRDRWKSQVVAITDPKKGPLRQFAEEHGLKTLDIAPSIGGRFSVFTPVGLFAIACSGLDPAAFLAGANQVRDAIEKTPLQKNYLFLIAARLLELSQKRSVHVCMPYSSQLKTFAQWWVQLWGESLGKDKKGFTPVAAEGATDQHSILQLLRDGPDDKITWFLTVGKIPGHTFQELLTAEFQATARVLSNQNRPILQFEINEISEKSIGSLSFSFCILTSIMGTLMEVNPFDQPGVEEGKIYITESLNQSQRDAVNLEDENSAVERLRRHRSSQE